MTALVISMIFPCAARAESRGDLLLIVGSPGTEEYGRMFRDWGQKWLSGAERGGLTTTVFGMDGESPATTEGILAALSTAAEETTLPLWIVLIGHGTFDGRTAKFNVSGPDLEAGGLAAALEPIRRPVAYIQCSSASGAFLDAVSGSGRVVVTATRSGGEVNFSHFGGFLAEAIDNPAADLDKDEQVSLLEAFLHASRKTDEFYGSDGRLATEHALLDDTGDGRGTRAEAYRGIRPVAESADPGILLDGHVAHQWHLIPNEYDQQLPPEILARRNELELQIVQLRQRKSSLTEDEYYAALENILVELAKLTVGKE